MYWPMSASGRKLHSPTPTTIPNPHYSVAILFRQDAAIPRKASALHGDPGPGTGIAMNRLTAG